MPDTAAPSVFISYSREDSAFVDRLEADLRARGFRTWVDRRRLEGGQDWQAEIDHAIDQHAVMVLVLSPNSTNSPAVTHEYQYATTRNKQVLPVLLQDCTPHYTIPQQWIEDFLRRDYATGLNALLGTLLFQQLSLTAPSRELYERATALKGHSQVGDKEQAAVILQRILDRDPGYLQGLVKGDLDQLTQSLYPSRAQNLRQQVLATRKTGEYGVEASTLEALIALGHADPCASEYLPLARQNSQFVDLYWVVQQQAASGALNDARDKLQFLWSKAPYYRDPASVAPRLGLTLPFSYEETKVRKIAEEQWEQEETVEETEFKDSSKENSKIVLVYPSILLVMLLALLGGVIGEGAISAGYGLVVVLVLICILINVAAIIGIYGRYSKKNAASVAAHTLKMEEINARHTAQIRSIAATYARLSVDPLLACWQRNGVAS